MKRTGFTLIELLVVIAIISILAAILFPAFVQAKVSAYSTTCLSNVRQVSLAQTFYLQDSDDTYPSVFPGTGGGVADPMGSDLTPYVKSSSVLQCPTRFDSDCLGSSGASSRCLGYGFNWGLYNPWDDGIGLLEPIVALGGLHEFMLRGKSSSSLTQPTSTFVTGDTWSQPPYTLAVFDNWNGAGSARHAERFNFAYADGHAKSLHQRHGFTAADTYVVGNIDRTHAIGASNTLSPSNSKDLTSYCSAPDSADCAAIVNWFLSNTRFDGLE